MTSIAITRVRKLVFSLTHPRCWSALRLGVAPAIEHQKLLREIDCDLLLDVGANRGQFSLISRMVKPEVPIVAFEPIPAEAETYRRVTAGFKNLELHQVALGEQAGESELHLSRSADSSSLLPIGELQAKLFPTTNEIGTLRVPVKRLDDFISKWAGCSRVLLKIDVQGFELPVLKGATETLKKCAHLYVECSQTELYAGQSLYPEVAAFLVLHGFHPLKKQNEQMADGRLVQADYLFGRK